MVNVAKAMAAYEFTLVSRNSAFDQYVRSDARGDARDSPASASRRRARRPPVHRQGAPATSATTRRCMSDSKFHNIGVPQVGPGVPTEADCPAGGVCDCVTVSPDHAGNNCLPWGAADGLCQAEVATAGGATRSGATTAPTPPASTGARWPWRWSPRAPGARPRCATWPSPRPTCTTGRCATLEEVIEHYNQGGSSSAPGSRSSQIKPLLLTEAEKADLIELPEDAHRRASARRARQRTRAAEMDGRSQMALLTAAELLARRRLSPLALAPAPAAAAPARRPPSGKPPAARPWPSDRRTPPPNYAPVPPGFPAYPQVPPRCAPSPARGRRPRRPTPPSRPSRWRIPSPASRELETAARADRAS